MLVMGVQNTWSPIENIIEIDKYLIIGNNRLFGYNISTRNLATVVREGIGLVLLTEASVVVPLTNKPYHQYNAPDSQVLPVAVWVMEDK